VQAKERGFAGPHFKTTPLVSLLLHQGTTTVS
jgi:hypothetical protein